MQTVSNTHDRLVIEDRPYILTSLMWILGVAALLAAFAGQTAGLVETMLIATLGAGTIAAAWHLFPFQRFTFDSVSGEFTRRIARVTGATEETMPLTEIERATLQSNWSDGAQMQRVALLTANGPMPLEYGFIAAERGPIVDDINTWLKRTR